MGHLGALMDINRAWEGKLLSKCRETQSDDSLCAHRKRHHPTGAEFLPVGRFHGNAPHDLCPPPR
jgi:hypothetical protein